MANRSAWIHGATIDKRTRALRFASVSSLDQADTSNDGCPRKFAYSKIEGIKEPETDKQKRGTEGHAQIEDYQKTGDMRKVGAEVATGLHVIPDPGPDLHLEWDVLKWPEQHYPSVLTEAHSASLLAEAPVKLAGVPLLGFIDCWHRRGINKGGSDVSQTKDPKGTVEVIDWKFTGDNRFWKKESELVKMTQLASYGAWAFTVMPDAPAVRLSLGYFPARGRVTKVSKLVRQEDIQPQIDHAAGVVRLLQHVAKETSAENVEANTSACDKYGGCFYRSRCSAPMKKTLAALVGTAMAEREHAAGNFVPLERVRTPMPSILNRGKTATPAPDESAIAAEQARIADAERRARLLSLVSPEFPAACLRVRKKGLGFPTVKGGAARALRAMEGEDSSADVVGSGDIAYVEISLVEEMSQLADELDSQEDAVPTLPPDAPASDPEKASDDPELQEAGPVEEASLPPPAPAPVEPAPKKRGPRAKPAVVDQTAKPEEVAEVKPVADNNDAIHLYVDCETSHPATSLDAWALGLAEDLARGAKCADIRSAPEGSELAFGKGKGLLAGYARQAPLPGGHYVLHTYGEILSIVAEALITRAIASGGSYTRGSR